MKTKTFSIIVAALAAIVALTSCGAKQEPSALIAQSDRIEAELNTIAEGSPMFIDTVGVTYADGNLNVGIAFCDSTVKVAEYSEALVEYVLSQYLKAHTGKNLDTVINTLAKEKGQLRITLGDVYGTSRCYPVGASRLVQLVKLKNMELNYNDVRSNIADILASQCVQYKDQYKAIDAEFEIKGGFAQYKLTFPRATAYANLNQASLTGRYLKTLQARYENYGECRPMIEELLRSLSIDGYRFIYTDKNETKTLSAAIPWRLIDK